MAYAVTTFQWTFAARGTRTRIWSGPLVHAIPVPVQWLIFDNPGGPNRLVSFVLNGWSAAPPFAVTASGVAMAWNFAGLSAGFPWDVGYPLWLASTPWLEVFVTPSINCRAQLRVM